MSSTNNDFKKENRIRLFGHEDAGKEKDARLSEYYFKTTQYEDIASDLGLQIVVGEKGTGKSALLKMAYINGKQSEDVALWIRLDDLSEIYEELLTEENLYKLKTLWKKAISRLVVMRLAEEISVALNEDYNQALRWAYESGYSKRDFIAHTAKLLKPLYEKYVSTESTESPQEHRVLERLITKQEVRLFFDDFDLDWKGNIQDVKRIKSLILSLSDMTSDMDGLSARIALRTDVYDMIRDQEFSDKFESSIIKCKWNNQQILRALAKRICTYYSIPFDEEKAKDDNTLQYNIQEYLNVVFEKRFSEYSRIWPNAPIHRVMFSLLRRKPRDMVKLCQNVAECAYEKSLDKIDGDCFISILDNYSQERMKDIINEYKNVIKGLEPLLMRMAPTQQEIKERYKERYVYTTAQLYGKIKNILQNVPVQIYNPNTEGLTNADVHDVAYFLYKIGFITGRKKPYKKIERVYFEQSPYLLKKNVGDGGYSWEIHPAYRAALALGIKDNWLSTIDNELEEDIE